MPAQLTKTAFKKRLSELFGEKVKLIGDFAGTMARTKFQCQCGHRWITQPQILIYGKRTFGCPKCAREHVAKANTAAVAKRQKSGDLSPWTDPQKYYDKVSSRWGDRFYVTGYKGAHSRVKIVCERCSDSWRDRPDWYLRANPCRQCDSLRAADNVSGVTAEFIVYSYTKLYFNIPQISQLTGLRNSTINGVLQDANVLENGAIRRGRKSVQLELKGRVLNAYKVYRRHSNRLAHWVYKHHHLNIDPAGLLTAGSYHLDHVLSVRDAFISYSRPLDLRLVNHPGNLQVLSAKDNMSKYTSSWQTLKELKRSARAYEAKYGKVKFPRQFKYNLRKKVDLSKLDGVTIIGLDPGSKNFGVFVGKLYGTDRLQRIKVLHSSMLQHTIHDLKTETLDRTIERFLDELGYLYDKYRPDIVVVERFQARGIKGSINETVNMMIGMILMQALQAYCEVIPVVKPCTPASWKVKIKKSINLEVLYKEAKAVGILPHQIDSAMLAINQYPAKNSLHLLHEKSAELLQALLDAGVLDLSKSSLVVA